MPKDVTKGKDKNNDKGFSFKKEDILGFVFGISLVWSVGLRGVIPYLVGISIGVWVTKKAYNAQKDYYWYIYLGLLVLLFVLGSAVRGAAMRQGL